MKAPKAINAAKAREKNLRAVQLNLDTALVAMTQRRPTRDRLKTFYSGAQIEQTWAAIQRASTSLYAVYEKHELPMQADKLHNLVEELPNLKPQILALGAAKQGLASDPSADKRTTRAIFREIHQQAMEETATLYRSSRALRNALLVSSVVLFTMAIALAIVHAFDPDIINVCGARSVEGGDLVLACPTGHHSLGVDVLVLELAGMLGGMLSFVIPIATGENIRAPYRVFNYQLLFKTAVGATAAVAGVVVLESGLVPGFDIGTPAEVLGYAVIFGLGQQILTGMIDGRANRLGQETPSPQGA